MGSVSVQCASRKTESIKEKLSPCIEVGVFYGSNRTVASRSKVLEDMKISRRCYSEGSVRLR